MIKNNSKKIVILKIPSPAPEMKEINNKLH